MGQSVTQWISEGNTNYSKSRRSLQVTDRQHPADSHPLTENLNFHYQLENLGLEIKKTPGRLERRGLETLWHLFQEQGLGLL